MDLLKAKRGSETHSDFLDMLGNLLSAAEFDQMTGDEMVIHLFKESADAQMARIAMDILEKENPTMRKLKVKVKETENGVLYSKKIMGKQQHSRNKNIANHAIQRPIARASNGNPEN